MRVWVCLATLVFALSACAQSRKFDSELQLFVSGDIKNAEVIAASSTTVSPILGQCLKTLEPIAMASPNPDEDGLLVVGVRTMALQGAVSGPCGQILAPLLLKLAGKAVPAPFGAFLPF